MKTILFFGDSLTSGLGLLRQEDAYPGLIQLKINSLGLPYQVINAGLSGENSAEGNLRIDSLLNENIDIFVLELGANDGMKGMDIDETFHNLQSIIDKTKAAWPHCKMVLAGMLIPPDLGLERFNKFKDIFPTLARKNGMALIPFLLENVATIPELNQEDEIHPTAEGQKIMAENVWKVLKDLL